MYGLNTENLMHITESASLDSKAGLLGLLVVVVVFYMLYQGIRIIIVNIWTKKLKLADQALTAERKEAMDNQYESKEPEPDVEFNGQWDDLKGFENDPDVIAARKTM